MLLNIPPPPPPRELEEAVLSHGGHLLSLTVLRAAGVRKDGEVRYRRHTTVYAVEKGPGLVRLIKSDGEGYTVTEFNCSCARTGQTWEEDSQFAFLPRTGPVRPKG
jgi:hypothetical protein